MDSGIKQRSGDNSYDCGAKIIHTLIRFRVNRFHGFFVKKITFLNNYSK